MRPLASTTELATEMDPMIAVYSRINGAVTSNDRAWLNLSRIRIAVTLA
jgi:hypothetical protein